MAKGKYIGKDEEIVLRFYYTIEETRRTFLNDFKNLEFKLLDKQLLDKTKKAKEKHFFKRNIDRKVNLKLEGKPKEVFLATLFFNACKQSKIKASEIKYNLKKQKEARQKLLDKITFKEILRLYFKMNKKTIYKKLHRAEQNLVKKGYLDKGKLTDKAINFLKKNKS